MRMKGKSLLLTAFFAALGLSLGAQEVVTLFNPSFEDVPRKGATGSAPIRGWHDCGQTKFPGESPPDIHPVPDHAWDVAVEPIDGNTYLGMVTRADDTWESLSQAVSGPIEAGTCYTFSCYLVQSPEYRSATAKTMKMGTNELENFVRPAVLKIWGGNSLCEKAELLGESPAVMNDTWKLYTFTFQPKKTHRFITIEAFYKTPILEAYNGHILLDAMSDIEPVACPIYPKDVIAEVSDPPAKVIIGSNAESRGGSVTKKSTGGNAGTIKQGTVSSGPKTFKPILLTELVPEKLYIGQKIRLNHLYFKSDSVNLEPDSYKVLNELADYLLVYPKTVIEIGGHTNTVPPENYCNELSTARARSVQQYLISRGVPESRLQYKGYGKSNPIIAYDRYNKEARLKNQRVEIKILSLS